MITYGSTTLTSYNSIVKTEVYYYKSTSPTALSGGSWSTAKPTWESGKYVWQKIRTIYEDETYTESDPVNITGQQGATGDAAYSYKLNASDTAVTVSKTGEYSVNKITFTATYKQGTGAVTAYAGRFKIETTTNGTNWTAVYTSSGNESSKEYTIPTNIIAIRCSLYQAGGTSVLLDTITIPIVNDDRPLITKTYTGLIGSANDAANASFYFAKIHPTNYTTNYKVKMKVRVTAPEAYAETIDIQFGGYGNAFSSYDAYTTRTNSTGIYYINLYRATQAGISTNHKGHALGVGLRSSSNPTNTSYKRTIIVDILELENCTIEMLDTAVKYASIDGTGSTNYSGLTEMGVANAGQNATNNTNTHYTQYSSNVKAGTNGIKGYSLIMKDSENTWSCFYSGAYKETNTGKIAHTGGFVLGKILYSAGAGTQTSDNSLDTYYNYKSGVNTSTIYDAYAFDFRYSSNCETTLIAQRPVYLVGTVHNNGKFYFDVDSNVWYTQEPIAPSAPMTEDGKVYIYVGMAYSTYQVWLSTENPAYTFYNGEFILYDKATTLQDIKSLEEDLQSQIDGKIETWCQKTNPANSWTAEERPNHTGDLWYYIGESGTTYKNNTTYQYNGETNVWSAYSANPDLFDKIDGKSSIYYGTTSSITSAEEGDYLVDSENDCTYRWNNGAWVLATDYKQVAIDAVEIGGRNFLSKVNVLAQTTQYTEENYVYTGLYGNGAGLKFPASIFEAGINYVLSFKFQKINGTLTAIGGHCTGFSSFGNKFVIDGIKEENRTYSQGHLMSDDTNVHSVEVYLTFNGNTSDNNLYIQPNRGAYTQANNNEFQIWDLQLEKGNQKTDWRPAPEDVEKYAQSIQSQVDGMAEIHYGTVVPTLSNAPYTSWGDTVTRDMHVDDLYYNTSTGYCYRFTKSGSTYSWTRIKDSDITAAATAASNANTAAGNAQTTANNANTLAGQKRRIFVATPTTEQAYDIGDLWVEGSTGDIKKCKKAKASGTAYNASDWELASKYTDDTKANTANTKVDNLKKIRLGWKVNYSTFTTANNGECYFHGYDSNNAATNDNGIVEWNGVDLTITKGMWINPNAVAPYNTPILHVFRTDTSPYHADVWWDDSLKKWRGYMYTTSQTPSTVSDWTWNETTDCILATYISPSSEGAIQSAQLFNPPKKFSELPDPSLAHELVDNIEIGGRNILLNSTTNIPQIYSSATLTVEKNVTVSEFECTDGIRCYGKGRNNAICLVINKNTHGLSTSSPISINNQLYVFSIYIKNNHSTNVFGVSSNVPGDTRKTIQPGEAKRLVMYTKGNGSSYVQFNLSTNTAGDDYDITYWHPQIELGNKVTDWTPAPQDVDANIQQVQDNLDNLKIGGRNLLKNSKALTTDWVLKQATVSDGIVTITPDPNSSDTKRIYQIPANGYWTWTVGQEYTVSIDARSDNGAPFNFVATGVGVNGNAQKSSDIVTTSTWARYSFTFTVVHSSEGSLTFQLAGSSNKTIQFKEPKLEYGGKATDWTPAPEDTQADIDTAIAQSVEYIIGTQTATTGTWTGRASTLSELKDGTQIRYWLPYAGSGNATLNLTLKDGTATGAIPVYRQGGSYDSTNKIVVANRVTTHFPAGTSISMVYGVNRVVSVVSSNVTYTGTFTGWFVDGAYNSDTYNRIRMQNAITAVTAITASRIICGTILGYKNIGAGIQFDLSYPLLYAASAITAGKTGDNNYLQINGINASNNGTIQSGGTKKELYLKGTITGNIFTIASSPFMTTVIPTSADDFYYIPLGIMSSATSIYFTSSNRLYAYLDGAFQPVDIAAALKANSAYDTAVQAQSEIVQTRQTLSLQIRDISVGGANLFEKTKAFEDTTNEMTAHDSLTEFTYKDLAIRNANSITFNDQVVELSAYKYTDLTSDMWYTFSFYAKGGLDIGFMYAGTGNATIDNIIVSWSEETYTGFNTTSTTSNIIWLTPTSNWQRYNIVFHVAEQEITASQRLIGLYARPTSNYTELTTEASEILTLESSTDSHFVMEGNEISICGYKLELGNKPTDWTPSEKDKTSYNNIISQINLSQEGVSIKADKINLEGTITANNGFIIDEYGNMTANNGTFNGLFESYATEINENTFDMKISNGHIHFYNNDRTLSEDERHVGYIGGIRHRTGYVGGSQKINDGIGIRLFNTNDFVISSYKNNNTETIFKIGNHTNDTISVDFWHNLNIYSGSKIELHAYQDSQYPEIQFYKYSKTTDSYNLRGSLSLHSVTDNNSDISGRLYLWAKNQGSDLAGDQWLYFTGKGLKYSSNGQSIRNGYVATDKYIVTQYFNLPNQTITKNTSKDFTIDVTREGYTPIMCVPKVGGGTNAFNLSIYTWVISGNTVTLRTHNNSSAYDVSDVTIALQVLYKLTY